MSSISSSVRVGMVTTGAGWDVVVLVVGHEKSSRVSGFAATSKALSFHEHKISTDRNNQEEI